jgi:hypothetical protein
MVFLWTVLFCLAIAFAQAVPSAAFSTSCCCETSARSKGTSFSLQLYQAAQDAGNDGPSSRFVNILSHDDFSVRKRICQPGIGNVASPGKQVSIEYTGTLASRPEEYYWSPTDVVECWLSEQQGLEHLKDKFLEHGVDSTLLLDPDQFNEEFVADKFQVDNKIQCKKLAMAARRLSNEREIFRPGMEFDSSSKRGRPYTFVLGTGKAIQAIDRTVATMKLGERCEMVTRCDKAYGKDGLRTPKGDIIVPPFANLHFDIILIAIE